MSPRLIVAALLVVLTCSANAVLADEIRADQPEQKNHAGNHAAPPS